LKEDRGRGELACQRYTEATKKNGTVVGSHDRRRAAAHSSTSQPASLQANTVRLFPITVKFEGILHVSNETLFVDEWLQLSCE
jgi:hypothetical protein